MLLFVKLVDNITIPNNPEIKKMCSNFLFVSCLMDVTDIPISQCSRVINQPLSSQLFMFHCR